MKSEPDTFSLDDLERRPAQTEPWNGVRNYQVRNMFRDQFAVGDQALFYYSNCKQPGVYGIMEVVSPAYPDPSQFDPASPYFDPGSRLPDPRWLLVDVRFVRRLPRPVLLSTLRAHADALPGLKLLDKGSRLSVVPVQPEHWRYILQLGES